MLYIKFNIEDSSKYEDFQKVYAHMVKTRTPGFNFQEDEDSLEIDWESLTTQKEIDDAVEELSNYLDKSPEFHRFQKVFPLYAQEYLEKYLQNESEKHELLSVSETVSIFNYLEVGFEVDMVQLERQDKKHGLIEFSTGNFPFGGLERFLITLNAFHLTPTEYFDGFSICELQWSSPFEYSTTKFPKKTKKYLKSKGVLQKNESQKGMIQRARIMVNNLFSKK